MLTAPQLSAGGAAIGLVASIVWLLTAEFPITDPGKPSTKADPVVILEAAVPAIGEFTQFNINDVNPFVPYNLRIIESGISKQPPKPAGNTRPKPAVSATVPAIILPKLGAAQINAPKATGVLISHDGPQAFMTFPGDNKATTLKPGDSVKGWTLVEVIGTNVARMRDDATGVVHNLVVAETANPSKAKPSKDAGDKSGDKDVDGKKPTAEGKGKSDQKPSLKAAPSEAPPADQKPPDQRKPEPKPRGVKPEANDGPPPAPRPAPANPPEKML